MRVTKAELEAQVAHYKRQNFYVMTVVMMLWAIALAVLVTHEYKNALASEASAEKYLSESLEGWQTEVIPAPEPQTIKPLPDPYILAPTKWIDVLFESITGISAAQAALHPMKDDLPTVAFPYPSPLKLWKIEQLATDRSHLACSATRNYAPGITITFTAYKDGTRSLVLSGVGFRLKPDAPYADTVISVDGGAHVQVVSKRIDDFETSVDLSSMELTQLSNSKILRVTINDLFAEFDLTGSANAAKYIAQCNTAGPVDVLQRRVEVASPALTR